MRTRSKKMRMVRMLKTKKMVSTTKSKKNIPNKMRTGRSRSTFPKSSSSKCSKWLASNLKLKKIDNSS